MQIRIVIGWLTVSLLGFANMGHAEPQLRILFESYVDSNWEICSVKPDGSDRQIVTHTDHVHELYPQASPSGSKICFLVDNHANGVITRTLYVMNSDGSGRKKIADGARHPCWSPDGQTIAFAKQEFKRFRVKDFVTKGLYFYDLKSGEIRKHPNERIEHIYVPTWSANGEWILATVHGGMGFGHAIVAIEVDGNRVVDLKISGCRPNLSPDGKRLTWSGDDHTINVAEVEYSANGPAVKNPRVLYQHKKLHLYHPDLSPDGDQICFSMGPGGRMKANGPGTQTEVAEMTGVRGVWDLYVKRVDSDEAPRRITFHPEMSNKESEWIIVP